MTSGGKRTQSEERAAQNEVSFRDANETIDRKRREAAEEREEREFLEGH